jgi:hypothetical protein
MANIRINAIATTATSMSSDDYFAIDGTTSSTRKMSAATPVFTTVQTTGTGTTATFAGSCSIATDLTVISALTQGNGNDAVEFLQKSIAGNGRVKTVGTAMSIGGQTGMGTIIQSGGTNAVVISANNQSATFAGAATIAGTVIHTLSATPATSTATGPVGTISWDSGYIYICTSANTWKRVAIATWP